MSLPHFFPFVYGCLVAALGILALGFLASIIVAPHLAEAMYLGVFLSAAAAGYSFTQRRKTAHTPGCTVVVVTLGLLTGLAAWYGLVQMALQYQITPPSPTDAVILAASGVIGAGAGMQLRLRYERID